MATSDNPLAIAAAGAAGGMRGSAIKVRLTLGPALIDLEATLEEIVVVVTQLTQEFDKAQLFRLESERKLDK